MTGPIDEAYVEIKPDLKDFDRDVQRELDSSFDKIEDKLKDLYDVIDKQFDRLIVVLDEHFSNLQHTANDTFDEIKDQARGAGRAIATDIEVGTKIAKHEIDDLADNAHHDFNRIERDARGSGFSIIGIFSKLGKGITNIFSNVGETVSNLGAKISNTLGSTIGQIGSSIGTVTGGIGSVAQFAFYGVLIPLAIGLAGALSQLVGVLAALPAAAGVAVAAILPLVLAFHGFSDAIGAVLEGDPDKINEALKKLSPSAAKVVKEFQALIKPFSEIQKLAQESFFKPLVGTLTRLAYAVLPALRTGVPAVATAFGNMFAFMARAFENLETTGVIEKVFASTARIINGMGPILGNLLNVVSNLFVDGLPYVERFFAVIGKGVDAFSHWLENAEDGGKIVVWLDKAWDVGKKLWVIIRELSIYVGTLLGAFADEGTDTLDGIGNSLKKINEYFKTSEGEETLHNLGVLIHWAGNAVVFLLDNFNKAHVALNGFFSFIRGIGPFFSRVGDWFKNTWDDIVQWTVDAWNSVKNFVMDAWNGIINFFTSTGSNIGSFFSNTWNSIVTGIQNFVHNTIATIQAFPAAFRQFIVDAIHWVAYQVGFAIGTLIKYITVDFPNAISSGVSWLVNRLHDGLMAVVNLFTVIIPNLVATSIEWFRGLWASVVDLTTRGISAVIDWVSKLPGRVWGFLSDMGHRSIEVVSNTWHTIVNYFKNLVSDAVAEARKLPGLIRDAWNSLLSNATDIGKDIVRGIVNGMRSLGGWLVDQAKQLAHDAWQGAKDAIGANSPSKEFAKLGKWSVQGFAQGFDAYDLSAAIARSVKLPLTNIGPQGYQPAPAAGTPQVSVGGAQIVAYFSVDGGQFHPVVVDAMYDNAQDVALAAQQGNVDLSRRR
jgi:hypothetical protein